MPILLKRMSPFLTSYLLVSPQIVFLAVFFHLVVLLTNWWFQTVAPCIYTILNVKIFFLFFSSIFFIDFFFSDFVGLVTSKCTKFFLVQTAYVPKAPVSGTRLVQNGGTHDFSYLPSHPNFQYLIFQWVASTASNSLQQTLKLLIQKP